MKVILRKPKNNWVNPFEIARKAFFWRDPEDPLVRRLGKSLIPFSRFLEKVLDFFSLKDKVRIDYWDSWDAFESLGLIILPVLKQIKEEKGIPFIDNEDVPKELRDPENSHCQKKWDYAIGEMIFAFESLRNDWEEQFYSGVHDVVWEPVAPEEGEEGFGQLFEMKSGPKDTFKVDWDGYNAYENRVRSGFTLFGKYYRSLWT